MSFETDNIQLESLYLNKIKASQLDEGLRTNLKAIGVGAILGILAHLTTFNVGSGTARHVHTSTENHKNVINGVNHIIHMSQDIIDCMNKRANAEQPASQPVIQQLRDVQFLYSELKSNTQNISEKDVHSAIEQLRDQVYASGLEDEPRLQRWMKQ
jgi:hypothetical protein